MIFVKVNAKIAIHISEHQQTKLGSLSGDAGPHANPILLKWDPGFTLSGIEPLILNVLKSDCVARSFKGNKFAYCSTGTEINKN